MKSAYLTLSTGTVHYLDSQGSGPTLLLLHGNSSAASAFAAQFAALGHRYRLLALDFPGHGQSAKAASEHYNFAGFANTLVEFVEHSQLHDYFIFGHSLGGHAALQALPRLHGLRGLGLLAAPPFNQSNASLLFRPDPSAGLVFQAQLDDTELKRLAQAFVNAQRQPEQQLEQLEHFIRSTDPQLRAALGASLGNGEFADQVALLHASKVPALLLQGRADGFIDAYACLSPTTFAPAKLQVQLFDGCGHCPHVEEPDRCNQLIDRFITHHMREPTMKALVINSFGTADIFEEIELPTPNVGPNQLLVQVAATGVNPLDYKMRRGDFPGFTQEFPAILHGDFAGSVVAVGTGVKGFAIGDEVYGCAGGVRGRQGALADYMLVDAALAALKPSNLTLAEAAVLPLVAITAWEGLIDKAAIQPGDRVLIHAGTGGVGHIAAQLAKSLGAHVYTTVSSPAKAELSLEYGADASIDYRAMTVSDYVERYTDGKGFDLVFDTVGGSTFEQSLLATRVGGSVISVLATGPLDMTMAWARKLTVHCVNMSWPMATGEGMEHHGYILRQISALVESGNLRPLLDPQRFSFKQISAAHRHAESGLALGKISISRQH